MEFFHKNKMKNLKLNQICHGISRWVVSALAAIILSSLVNFANAAGPKTYSRLIDSDNFVPSYRDQYQLNTLLTTYEKRK